MDKAFHVPIKDIFIRDPIAIDINAPFSKVAEYFHEHHIRHLPVVDSENILRGIISERDLYRVCPPRRTIDGENVFDADELDKFILKHVMTKDPFTLRPLDTLDRVIDVMVSSKFGCIPIVGEFKQLIGIITQIDVLKAVKKYYIKADSDEKRQ